MKKEVIFFVVLGIKFCYKLLRTYDTLWSQRNVMAHDPFIYLYIDSIIASHFNPYRLFKADITRGSFFSERKTDVTLRDIVNKPVILMMKTKSGTETCHLSSGA
jgi:hypothetical protein